MSLTSKFLSSPILDARDESVSSDLKNYRGGVRGKRLLLGLILVCAMYLIAIGNLVTLIVLSSALRLNSRGSYYLSLAADNLRVYSPLLADRIMLDGSVASDSPVSLSSLSEVQLRAGTLLSDQAGIISQTSVLSVSRDSILTHNFSSDLILRANLETQQLVSRAGAVRVDSLLQAGELSAGAGIETAAIQTGNMSLLVLGDSAKSFEGGRGASLSTETLLVSADNSTLSLRASTISVSAYDSVLLSGGELASSDGSVRSPQLRLCACQNGALFLLSNSNNCRLRGPAGDLC